MHIILGGSGDFRGSIYRMEVYNYLFTADDSLEVSNNEVVTSGSPSAAWDFYDLRAAFYEQPSLYDPDCSNLGINFMFI